LVKQGLATRGYDESAFSLIHGNFKALVNVMAKGNKSLATFLTRKHANYTSPDIQNEVIGLFADDVRQKILSDMNSCKYFSTILDETSDITHIEQVAFCVRYVKETNRSWYTSGLVAKTDGEIFETFGLQLNNVVAQCYDGVANMRGEFKGSTDA
jgi:hypothetical protein